MLQKVAVSLPQLVAQPSVSVEHLTWATDQVNLFFGSFRKADADDPETFMAGCLRLFTAYPPQAVQYVVDPVTGLPGKIEWLPSMKAIKEALDAWEADQRRARERVAAHEAAARQIAERRAWQERQQAKPTLEELQAKHGESFGLTEPPPTGDRVTDALIRANVKLFQEECRAAGIDPSSLASPRLIAFVAGTEH